MKTLAFTIALTLCAGVVYAQSSDQNEVARKGCLPEGITFGSQEKIDNFQADYPGCTEIEGDVKIEGSIWWGPSDIKNLDGLSTLTSIGGSLSIGWNIPLLEDLSGLANLATVMGDFTFCECPLITDLDGLQNLSYVGGELRIEGSRLINLSGLESVTYLNKLTISENVFLEDLTGIDNIAFATIDDVTICDNGQLSSSTVEWICDYLMDPPGSINIYNNANGFNGPDEVASACGFTIDCLPYGNYHLLSQSDVYGFPIIYPDCGQLQGDIIISGASISSLSSLDILTSIGGSLTIMNTKLSDLEGLENLTMIAGDVLIQGNSITSLDGLSGVTSMGSLVIRDNDNLPDLMGLENLSSVSSLEISMNWLLTDLTGLEGITMDNLEVDHNLNLAKLTGLEHITSLNNLFVSSNILLESLTGLENLSIANNIALIYNHRLENVSALNNLTTVEGGFSIQNNKYKLKDLSGLNNLASIGGDFEIYSNESLTSLTGLENLSSIGGMLRIDHNNSLHNINSLSNLTEVYGNCRIKSNATLTSLSGLDNVEAASIQNLFIGGNESLSMCNVKSVCDYLADPNGTVEIHSNTGDCSDQAAVKAACGVGIEENLKQPTIQVRPNPVRDGWVTFTFDITKSNGIAELRCFNVFGQEVHTGQLKSHSASMALNTRDWKAGIYLVVVYADGKPMGRSKFVVK